MYRLHKFRFILCKTQPFVQEISACDGESFRLAAPPQWLQKENNFLTKSVFVGFLPLRATVKRIFPYRKSPAHAARCPQPAGSFFPWKGNVVQKGVLGNGAFAYCQPILESL